MARFLAWLLRLPAASDAAFLQLVITPVEEGFRWTRTFGDRTLVTLQTQGQNGIWIEQYGWLELMFRREERDGSVCYQHQGSALRLGRFRIPLPRRAAPHVKAKEEPGLAHKHSHARVEVYAPLVGLLLWYEGEVEVEKPMR